MALGLTILLLIALGGSAYWLVRDRRPKTTANNPAGATNNVNLSPPTEEEKQAAQKEKEEKNQSQPPATTNASDGRKNVTPLIAYADATMVSAYIPGIFEEGGACTATFTYQDNTITQVGKGFQNSNYTSCEPLTLQSPLNIKGEWEVVVSYSSTRSVGTSAATKIKVN